MDIVSYGNCWKFEDADMVCYEGPAKELYIVFSTNFSQMYKEQVQGTGIQINAVSETKLGGAQEAYVESYGSKVEYVPTI